MALKSEDSGNDADTVPISNLSQVLRNIRNSSISRPSEPPRDRLPRLDEDDPLVFAKLVPSNRAACRAFDAIAQNIKADESWKPHHRQYIVVEGPGTLPDVSTTIGTDVSMLSQAPSQAVFEEDTTASESDSQSVVMQDTLLKGHYRLSLDVAPQYARIGWRVGSGRPKHANDAVDFLLTPPGWHKTGVAGLHARFQFERRSGALMLVASNLRGTPVNLNGSIFAHDMRVMGRPNNTIEFGDLSYTFVYMIKNPAQEKQFQQKLQTYFQYAYGTEPIPSSSATPSAHDRELGEYVLRNTLARGGSGIVSVANHSRTGAPVAVKEILRTKWNHSKVNAEIDIFRGLKHVGLFFRIMRSVCSRCQERLAELFDVFYERGESRYYTRDSPERIYLFLTLAQGTFRALFTSHVELTDRQIFFRQGLEGIEFLHQQGIMHRDVKPANLAVKSFDPPGALVIDFGCATQELRSNVNVGTIPYLAPEIRSGSWHDRSIDIFSYGIVGLELFLLREPAVSNTPRMNAIMLQRAHQRLSSGHDKIGVESLLMKMLQWKAMDRISASAALEHPSLMNLGARIHLNRESSKRAMSPDQLSKPLGGSPPLT
ncbi:MAG: hypothetical protein Q9227_005750 [Pyrenula ochraceoflavens]